jgi:DNA ligase-associated metallophosphoesterase
VSLEAPPSRPRIARRVDGHLALGLAGAEIVCLTSGALWLVADQVLVVADLHLEKGSSYARRGQLLPPYDTRETLDRLEAVTAAMAPRAVILLGDTFHDAGGESRLNADDHARIGAIAVGRTLIWVTGNHDRAGPRVLPGDVVASLEFGRLRLAHEPAGGPSPGEIAGHLHPCARVQARGGVVRRRCFATDGERIILPAFGALAGGLNVCDPAFAPLLRGRPLALVLGTTGVHAIGWTALRGDRA